MEKIRLNVSLLRRKVPNLTSAAKSVGLRPATVSNLCTGKIPVERCEVRTLVALASLANCSLDDLLVKGDVVEMIETKIKCLDLFAPIVKGGTIGLVARQGMGQLVILAELFFRFKKEGYAIILLKPEENHPDIQDISNDVDCLVNSIDDAYNKIAEMGKEKDIIFAADRSHVVTGEIYTLQERIQGIDSKSVTTFLLDINGGAADEDLPYGPLETIWHFDQDLAARHKFPAINPLSSISSVLEDATMEQKHFSIQQRAQKLIRRYRELRSIVNVKGITGISSSEIETYHRGERLEAYLTQPFYVAEEFTGIKGAAVSLQDALQDVKRIIDGEVDSKTVQSLDYIGILP